MSLRSDCILGVVGILPDDITPKHLAAAEALPGIFAKRLARWAKTEEMSEFVYVPPPADMDKLFAKLAIPPSQLDVAAWLDALDVNDIELSADFFMGLTKARQHLVDVWPKLSIEGAAGPRILELSYDDREEVASIFAILDEPTRVLDELDARVISPTQALAFREVYPELYKLADEAIDAALIEARAKDDDFDLDWERAAVLNTFRGKPPEALYTPPPPAPVGEKGLKLDPDRERTQEQVSSAPKTRK